MTLCDTYWPIHALNNTIFFPSIEALEDPSKENTLIEELKSNHKHEIESYNEQISNLQRNLDLKSSKLSEATETIQTLEKSNQNVEALDKLRSHHNEEMESYKKQISELQNTLEAKSLELSELSERIEILTKSEAGEFFRILP